MPAPPPALRRLLWFIALWFAGVGALAAIALLIRAMIP
jgi:Protein of unknown function (DUF2474)